MRIGVLPPWRRRRERRERELAEDALKHLLGLEHQGRRATLQSLAGALKLSDRRLMALAGRLEREGLVRARGQDLASRPTVNGWRCRSCARIALERYFADEARLPLSQVHAAAERREHPSVPPQVDRSRVAGPSADRSARRSDSDARRRAARRPPGRR